MTEKRLPVMEDYLLLRYCGSLTAAGRHIAWTESRWDTESPEGSRRFREEVHTGELSGNALKAERIITAGGTAESSPRLDARGRLWFLSDAARPLPLPEQGTVPGYLENEFFSCLQLYCLDGSSLRQVTHLRYGVESYLLSPDGKRVLISGYAYHEAAAAELLRERTAEEIREAVSRRLAEPFTTESAQFKSDAELGYRSDRKLCLFLQEEDSCRMLDTRGTFAAPCWLDDSRILFQRRGENDSLLFCTLDVTGGEPEELASVTNVSLCYSEHSPVLTEDAIIFAANTPGMAYADPRILAAIPKTGGCGIRARLLVSAEADTDGILPQDMNFMSRGSGAEFVLLPDGKIYYTTGIGGDVRICRVPWDACEAVPEPVTGPMENYHCLCAAEGGRLLALCGLPTAVPEPALIDPADGSPHVLTDTNPWLREVRLQQPVSKTTASGTQGFYLSPVTDAEKVPVICFCHGGPTGFCCSALNYELQALAAAGFGVVCPNPRGGTGFGRERSADHFAYDGAALSDIEGLVDLACAEDPRLDAGRAGICGGSYGGFLTLYAAVHSSRFRAACAHRALADMKLIGYASHSAGGSSREEHPDFRQCLRSWLAESITPLADRITIPLQLLYSRQDANCIPEQGSQLLTAVRAWRPDLPCRMILYPDSGHGLLKKGPVELAVHHRNANLDWFRKYL